MLLKYVIISTFLIFLVYGSSNATSNHLYKNLDTSNILFLTQPHHSGLTQTREITYTAGSPSLSDDTEGFVYAKVDSISFFTKTDPASFDCSGVRTKLDLSTNTFMPLKFNVGGHSDQGEIIGNIHINESAITSAAAQAQFNFINGSCVQIHIVYKNGNSSGTVGSSFVSTSSQGRFNPPYTLSNIDVSGQTVNFQNIKYGSVSIDAGSMIEFSELPDRIIDAEFTPNNAKTITIKNIGYSSLSLYNIQLPQNSISDFNVSCAGDLLPNQSCSVIFQQNSQPTPGNGAIYISTTYTLGGQKKWVLPYNVRYQSAGNAASLKCWGSNSSGQIGNGFSGGVVNTPSVVGSGFNGIIEVSSGNSTSCALNINGDVYCWGNGNLGQIGNGSSISVTSPSISSISDVLHVYSGGDNVCALLKSGGALCWGDNNHGQVGDGFGGTNVIQALPTFVSGLDEHVVKLTLGGSHTCALLDSGQMKCWGNDDNLQLGDDNGTNDKYSPVDVINLLDDDNIIDITAGGNHTCVLLSTGRIKCWGWNSFGQTGVDPSTANPVSIPTDVNTITNAASAISGNQHTCALLSDGSIRCWGLNADGQLGNGDNISTNVPQGVSSISDAVSVQAGNGYHTCALRTTPSTMNCWGSNNFSQLGNLGGSSNVPTSVTNTGSDNFSQMVLGEFHTCAVVN